MDGDLREASGDGEVCEDCGDGCDEQPIEGSTRRLGFGCGLAAVHAGLYGFSFDAVALALAMRGLLPLGLLGAGGGGERYGGDACHHQQRPADYLCVGGMSAT